MLSYSGRVNTSSTTVAQPNSTSTKLVRILFASIRPRLVNQSGINDVNETVLPSTTDIGTAKSELTTRTDHAQARARACTRAHCHAVQTHTYNSKRHIGRALSRQTLALYQTLAALTWISDLTRDEIPEPRTLPTAEHSSTS